MHILIAPNAFKNSLDAAQAAQAIARGLEQSRLACTTECFPVADGGLPVSEMLSDDVISLPIHAYLDESAQDRVIEAVRGALSS